MAETISIATWNVNSIRQRLSHLLAWLEATRPDVVCLQETKVQDEAFPRGELESLGFHVAVAGQKTFNGVALLSRYPLQDLRTSLPGDDEDQQARYLEAIVVPGATALRVASIYLPNGNPAPGEKYAYKLRWMERLRAHASELLALEEPLVLAGDYNVIPEPRDARDPPAWRDDALYLPESRAALRRLQAIGLADALRLASDDSHLYTFWDYQAGAWQRDHGIRIDHLLLSPQAADRLVEVRIDRNERARDKPSDHVPVRALLRA